MITGTEQAPKGLVHALLLDGKGGAENVDWQNIAALSLQQRSLWLHFDYSEPETQQWITLNSGLNDVAVEGLLNTENRPSVLTRGDNLLLTLRGVNLNPGADPEDMVSVRIWTNGKLLISTRKRTLLSTLDVVSSLKEGEGPKNTGQLLTEWIDRIVRRMSDTVNLLEDSLLEVEDQLFNGDPKALRSALLQARKQSIGIRRYIAPQREALNRLIAEPIAWLDDMDRLNLRSISDRQIRYIEDIDAAKERASMAQEELVSRVSEQMNNRSYVLTIVAAIFLPLGFFTGLMGINVGGMPGIESGQAFWVVLVICFLIAGLLWAIFYWRKWL
ncbi:zinc transporter ZntB [Neptunomonas marina]|uniref:Zinc transporter ZntB n=1 Tax=Neptunomonas marina TaxID=1815562 RepID=A0A437Q4L2_9GAMM|nr:zinc transporter ZntB [Neptunomonas marina]RVU29431.1 zinc transporter ZntB [Neptunomonas marina]